MLPAVQFNNDMLIETYEVHNKPADGLLTPEFEAYETLAAQVSPKESFGVG